MQLDNSQRETDLQLILSDAVESEILVVDWMECSAEDASLHLVMFIRQQLELDVRIARADIGVARWKSLASDDRYVQRALFNVVPFYISKFVSIHLSTSFRRPMKKR